MVAKYLDACAAVYTLITFLEPGYDCSAAGSETFLPMTDIARTGPWRTRFRHNRSNCRALEFAMPMEPAHRPLPGLRQMVADSGGLYLANAVIAFIFAASGPVAIVLAVGARGGLSESDLSSWIFGSFFLNGLITLLFCTLYRQPLVFLWTIPGTVLVGPALAHLSWGEVIGAFCVTGLLMLVLGLSGWVRRAMQAVPMPIVMGMVAGVFLRFGLGLVYAVRDDFWIAAPMIVVFLVLSASARWSRRLPPLIGALLVGSAAIAFLGKFHPHGSALHVLAHPNLYVPMFSWRAMVELVIPLAITVLVVQNGQGIAVLNAAEHKLLAAASQRA